MRSLAAAMVVATTSLALLACRVRADVSGDNGGGGDGPLVATRHGLVRGLESALGSHVFLGVPYAQPPVGHLRWHPPQPRNWTGVWVAQHFSNQCHNTVSGNSLIPQKGTRSEDCLYLNIWVPPSVVQQQQRDGGGRLADVVVFIHGGGFILGSASNPYVSPRPEHFAVGTGTVVVSFNYRLGVLGFLSHASLPHTSGLTGVLDQVGVLRWVQENIERFGGNPHSVTVLGESAGALSICMLMTMPSTAGLFHRVVLQSPMCDFPFMSAQDSQMQGEQLVKAVNCHRHDSDHEVAECLMARDPEQLVMGLRPRRGILFYDGVLWFPVVDGRLVPRPPMHSIIDGEIHADLRVLLGYNLDEASMFVLLGFPVYVEFRQSIEILESAVGSTRAYRLEKLYNTNRTDVDVRQLFNRMMSDLWACSVHRTALALSTWMPDGVFLYHFRHAPSHVPWPLSTLGAYHSAELAYVFDYLREGNFTSNEKLLSSRMMAEWGSFVATGSPQSSAWRPYGAQARGQFEFELDMAEEMAPWPREVCMFWDGATVNDQIVVPPAELHEPWLSRFFNEGLFTVIKRLISWRALATAAVLTVCAYAWTLRRTRPSKQLEAASPASAAPEPEPKREHRHHHHEHHDAAQLKPWPSSPPSSARRTRAQCAAAPAASAPISMVEQATTTTTEPASQLVPAAVADASALASRHLGQHVASALENAMPFLVSALCLVEVVHFAHYLARSEH